MRRALIASSLLHVALLGAMVVGLPDFGERLPVEEAISVEIIDAGKASPTPPAPAPAAAAPLPQRQAASPAPPPPPPPAPEPPKPPEPPKVAQAEPPPPPPPPPTPLAPPPPPPPPPPPAPEKPPAPVAEKPAPKPEPPKEVAAAKPEVKPEPAPPTPPTPPRAKPEPPKEAEKPKPPEKPPEPPKVAERPKEPEKPQPVPPPPQQQAAVAKPAEKPRESLQPPKADAKPAPDDFDALLRSVETQTKRVQAPEKRDGKASSEQAGNARAKNDLAEFASAAETSALAASARRQLEACWNVPAGLAGAETVESFAVDVRLKPDGTAEGVAIVDQGRLSSDPLFRILAESAQRAAWRCKLSLPAESYALWRAMTVTFDPKRAITG